MSGDQKYYQSDSDRMDFVITYDEITRITEVSVLDHPVTSVRGRLPLEVLNMMQEIFMCGARRGYQQGCDDVVNQIQKTMRIFGLKTEEFFSIDEFGDAPYWYHEESLKDKS